MKDIKKMTKKEKKQYYSQFRGDWNGVKPTSRVVPDKRKKCKGGCIE